MFNINFLPKELKYKIYFMSRPVLSKELQKEIKNHKFVNKNYIRFNHPYDSILWILRSY